MATAAVLVSGQYVSLCSVATAAVLVSGQYARVCAQWPQLQCQVSAVSQALVRYVPSQVQL